MSSRRGLLFVISAPSGTGKTTLVERLVQILPNLRMSRPYTSRSLRTGEREGVDYHFITRRAFEGMIAENAFAAWADVFGNLYGTAAADVEGMLADGQDVVLVIDVQGARQVRQRGTDHTAVFVMPPSFQVLERRLRCRSTEPEAALQRRLETARAEVSSYREYDYVVVNDDLQEAFRDLKAILRAERKRRSRIDAGVSAFVDGLIG